MTDTVWRGIWRGGILPRHTLSVIMFMVVSIILCWNILYNCNLMWNDYPSAKFVEYGLLKEVSFHFS